MSDLTADDIHAWLIEKVGPVDRWWTVGSSGVCNTVIADPEIADVHAVVARDCDGRYWVADLGSRAGTYLALSGVVRRVDAPTEWLPGEALWVGPVTHPSWTMPH